MSQNEWLLNVIWLIANFAVERSYFWMMWNFRNWMILYIVVKSTSCRRRWNFFLESYKKISITIIWSFYLKWLLNDMLSRTNWKNRLSLFCIKSKFHIALIIHTLIIRIWFLRRWIAFVQNVKQRVFDDNLHFWMMIVEL